MVLKAGPEKAPHPPIPFCIKKFRKHQKFGPLAQLGERMVLKADPESTPHQPVPFCIKKFRKHQKFGPLAQLGERMVLKADPESTPHQPVPFCIKKFRKHQKFGPLAQLGERKVRNLEVRGSIPLRSTIQEATRLGGFFVFSEVWLRSIVQCAVTVKCRFYTNLIQLEKLPKHRPQNRSVLRFFIYKSESKR